MTKYSGCPCRFCREHICYWCLQPFTGVDYLTNRIIPHYRMKRHKIELRDAELCVAKFFDDESLQIELHYQHYEAVFQK